mgnify:FL=1
MRLDKDAKWSVQTSPHYYFPGEADYHMSKILYVVSNLRRCGPTTQLLSIIRSLDGKYEPEVLTMSPEPDYSLRFDFDKEGVSLSSMGLSRLQGVVRAKRLLLEKIRLFRPDIIHTQGIRADSLSAGVNGNHLKCATIRNYPWHDYPTKFGKVLGTMMALQHIHALKRIDWPIACSHAIAKLVSKYGLKPKIIQNGVETDHYRPVKEGERKMLRMRLGLPVEAKIVIAVGSLNSLKNTQTVIRGLYDRTCHENVLLLLAGSGPMEVAYKALAIKSPNIRFLGQVTNVADYLRASDVFASASLSEGLPNSVLEALSCGLPVVISDIPQHREILDYGPTAGVLFPVKRSDILTRELDEMLKVDKTPQSASLDVAQNFLSAIRMSSSYQEVYDEMIA